MKVLHITNWFSNPQNPSEASWIRRHIDALGQSSCENEIWHVQTMAGTPWSCSMDIQGNLLQWRIGLPTARWILVEVVTFLQLLWLGIRYRRRIRRADVVNFHIAYPLLVFWKLLKPFYVKPVVITEHWSAYHFNFGVKKSLPRIQRIFRQDIPVITVSSALANDIERFSGGEFESMIVPNVVDTNVFFRKEPTKRGNSFFMVSQWKAPKMPFVVMEAFLKANEGNGMANELLIGGYGEQWPEIEQWARERDKNQTIRLLGLMDADAIADEMRRCMAFLHSSNYETFSVVCAEALCCGTPVIASGVGGITEFVNNSNGIIVTENEVDLWHAALNQFIELEQSFNNMLIAQNAAERFSVEHVGQLYYNALCHVYASHNKLPK